MVGKRRSNGRQHKRALHINVLPSNGKFYPNESNTYFHHTFNLLPVTVFLMFFIKEWIVF